MYTLFESEEHIFTSLHAHLPSLSVMPAHPAAAVTAVLDPVSLGKLITHAVGVPTLGAHERDEVQRAQVHLEILFEAVRLWHDVRTPSPVTVSVVKVKSDGEQENKWKSRYRKPRSQSSGTQTQGKRQSEEKCYKIRTEEKAVRNNEIISYVPDFSCLKEIMFAHFLLFHVTTEHIVKRL